MIKKSLVPKFNKINSDVVMTPASLGKRIIDHFNLSGNVLEPCMGDGKGFFQHLINKKNIKPYGLEINLGLDFFNFNTKVDWIITNPPFSIYSNFLEHALKISDNIVFLYLLPGVFFKKRLRLIRAANFGIKELIYIDDQPKPFPKFGFQLGAVYYQKNYQGDIKITDWRE